MLLALAIASSADVQRSAGSILLLDLSGDINERVTPLTLQDIMYGYTDEGQSLEDILTALRRAKDDDQIEMVMLMCNGANMGYAGREELITALKAFKTSGKPVYAYGDNYTQADYYVAACADSVFVNPVGSVDVRGMAVQIPFFKNVMDKLGVEMQIVKVGTFKSAVEPYILSEASEASQLQTRVYLDAIWNNICGTISNQRKVSKSVINQWADSLLVTEPAEYLVKQRAVSRTCYFREVEDMLRDYTGTDYDQAVPYITPTEYLGNSNQNAEMQQLLRHLRKDNSHIAILYAVGDIVDAGSEGIVGPAMVDEILALANDDDVAGMVLRVNSGGGSAFASEQIWEAIEHFKSTGKPVYVSMSDYAASGGYYISCGAKRIYADANTLTGSIGIFGMIPNIKGLVTDKIGVNFTTVATNANGDFGTITQPLTPAQHAALQRSVDDGYALFTSRVAKGRNLPIDSVLAIAEGRVWDGRTAQRIGLVDSIGGLEKAVADLAKHLHMRGTPYRTYPQLVRTPVQELLSSASNMTAGMSADLTHAALTPAEMRQTIRFAQQLRNSARVQARMSPIVLR